MLRTTVFPVRSMTLKPSFWGFDRDLKDVIEGMEDIWYGDSSTNNFSLKETDKAYLLSLDMPGVNTSNLDAQIEDNELMIIAKKKSLFEEDGKESEIRRKITIPQLVDKERIQAKVVDGVLYVALPKVEKAKPQKINITNGDSDDWGNLLNHE